METQVQTHGPLKITADAIGILIKVLTLAWIALHLSYLLFIPFSLDELCVLHVGIGGIILTLGYIQSSLNNTSFSSPKNLLFLLYFSILFVLCIICTYYFFVNHGPILDRIGRTTFTDAAYSAMFIMTVLLICAKVWGVIIPIVIFASMAYGVFGPWFGGVLFHTGLDIPRILGYSATFYSGMFGSLAVLSAGTIVHFLIFGGLLQSCGGTVLIERVSYIIGARFRSGAAQTAVYGSTFIGTITGSTAANVATTGPLTIPMMKRNGYEPEFAGAVEAVASTGGQFIPPIMGVTAFLIAALVGVPYINICIAALLPAVVYYANLSFAVFVATRKRDIHPKIRPEDVPDYTVWDLLREHWVILLPIAVLAYYLFSGLSPGRSVIMANLSLVSFCLLQILWRALIARKGLQYLLQALATLGKSVYTGLLNGGQEAIKLGLILSAMGIIIEMFTATGFGQRLSYHVVMMGGEHMLLMVVLIALLTIFFGLGMPTPGAYLLTILMAAQALMALGFEELSIHFFVFYFAIMSAVTPPVAIAVLIASGIAKSNYWGTIKRALILAFPGFLMPFYFLYFPDVLNLQNAPLQALYLNAVLLIAMFGLTFAVEGFYLKKISPLIRLVFLGAVLATFHPEPMSTFLGALTILILLAFHYFKNRDKEGVAT